MTIEYLAGIVDGEGHIYRPLCKNGRGERHAQSRIVVVNTHFGLLFGIRLYYGGGITPMKKPPGHKQCWRWQIVGKKAEELGRKLQPHLIVKAEQVKRIIQ